VLAAAATAVAMQQAVPGTARYEVHYQLQQSGNGRQKKCVSQSSNNQAAVKA